MQKTTSWGEVADWYDNHLEHDPDSYHMKVIKPNLTRLMNVQKGQMILDLACGQGFFARGWAELGAEVLGADISPELIAKAQEKGGGVTYHTTSADSLGFIESATLDTISLVLAIQNIENARGVLKECARVLKSGGRLLLVLNHPAFRIPRASSWEFDEKSNTQYRRVDQYMSESRVEIDMHPGKMGGEKTVSFHRPLQWYMKALKAAGLALTGIEEWISHKESTSGPRATEENRIRKEIPLFLTLEITKL